MAAGLTFPDTKISEAFLEFAEPLLASEGGPPAVEEVEGALKLAFMVWNAVVLDTVHGKAEFVTQLRERIANHPPLSAMIEQMILRKQTLFGHDLRLVGEYKLVERDGEWRLRVEAREPAAK